MKEVHVRSYRRFRNGKEQIVCEHYRNIWGYWK